MTTLEPIKHGIGRRTWVTLGRLKLDNVIHKMLSYHLTGRSLGGIGNYMNSLYLSISRIPSCASKGHLWLGSYLGAGRPGPIFIVLSTTCCISSSVTALRHTSAPTARDPGPGKFALGLKMASTTVQLWPISRGHVDRKKRDFSGPYSQSNPNSDVDNCRLINGYELDLYTPACYRVSTI